MVNVPELSTLLSAAGGQSLNFFAVAAA